MIGAACRRQESAAFLESDRLMRQPTASLDLPVEDLLGRLADQGQPMIDEGVKGGACAGLVGCWLLASTALAEATKWAPLPGEFSYVCVDLDSVRTDADGWTRYSLTYCSGEHGNRPAEVMKLSLQCAAALSNQDFEVRLYSAAGNLVSTTRGGNLERVAASLVCAR
jgi:hypothetical protein